MTTSSGTEPCGPSRSSRCSVGLTAARCQVSSHILHDASGSEDGAASVASAADEPWPLDKLQRYFHHCRQKTDLKMVSTR